MGIVIIIIIIILFFKQHYDLLAMTTNRINTRGCKENNNDNVMGLWTWSPLFSTCVCVGRVDKCIRCNYSAIFNNKQAAAWPNG